jgi:hypothetical protein
MKPRFLSHTINKSISVLAYPMETNSVSFWRSTAFFKGVTPYRFCSLEISREMKVTNRGQFHKKTEINFMILA